MLKTLMLGLMFVATQMQAVLDLTPSKHKNHIDICGKPVYIGNLVIRALLDGDAALLSALLKMGCIDVNEKIVCGTQISGWKGQSRTPLEWITINDWRTRQEKYPSNRGECVKILIKAGANINTVDQRGNNLLKEAIENKQTDVLEILIAAGADVNNSTGDRNLLFEAISISYVDGVRLLLMAPNINIDKQFYNKTPFDYATQDYFNFQIIELFQEYFRQQETLKAENEILEKEQSEQQAVLKKQHDAKKLAAWHDFNTRKEFEDKSTGKVLVLNPSESHLQLSHTTDVPAQSKAVITTEISKI